MSDQITVTQADIDAARSIWHRCDDGPYCELPQWLVQAFARFERDILATRTDATPVAWMPIESAPTKPKRHGSSSGPSILTIGTDQVGLVTETRYLDPGPFVRTDRGSYHKPAGWYWAGWDGAVGPVNPTHWQPLPAAPDHIEESRAMVSATDVAALVEAAKAFAEQADMYDSCEQHTAGCPDTFPAGEMLSLTVGDFRAIRAALAPFTKG